MSKFKLGQWVRGGPELLKNHDGPNGLQRWINYGWQKGVTEGVYTGFRHYQQGRSVWGGADEGSHWEEDGPRLKVGLIVVNERQKPVPVIFETLEGI